MRASDSVLSECRQQHGVLLDGPTSHCSKAAMQVVPHSELASRSEFQNLPLASGSGSSWEAYSQEHFHIRLYFMY